MLAGFACVLTRAAAEYLIYSPDQIGHCLSDSALWSEASRRHRFEEVRGQRDVGREVAQLRAPLTSFYNPSLP